MTEAPKRNKRVLVAMSGGVDSSVAALLLKEQGYEVTGATMQIWQDDQSDADSCDRGCCSLSAVEDARRVARCLDIPYYVLNFKSEFRAQVIEPFIDAYCRAQTPNPCILCNRHVKFEQFLQRALALGFDCIATGHYGKIVQQGERRYLARSEYPDKDQSYALYTLTQDQLQHLLLPLGDLPKTQVRQLAERAGLPVAHKRDSQEICFVPDRDYAGFIQQHRSPAQPGAFVLEDGTVLGTHRGLIHYTIGQRKGLGIAYSEPLFVRALRPETNEVVLGTEDQLYQSALIATDCVGADMHWSTPQRIQAKIRYRAPAEPATAYPLPDGKLGILFDKPQRAITPGQAVVCYRETLVLGGATILQAVDPEAMQKEWSR